jgi:hypothetical protein
MPAQGRYGGRCLSGHEQAHDLAVLVASADVSAALLVERDRHVAAGNELAQDVDEDAIAERLCEVEVEGAGELHGRERAAALACASLATLRRRAASRARVMREAPSASMLHSISRRTS